MSLTGSRIGGLISGAIGHALLCLVTIYRYTFSLVTPGHCRFQPTCSAYAAEAICRHGPFHGTVLAIRRILRCNPWGPFGEDPVPPARDRRCDGGGAVAGRLHRQRKSAQ